MKMTPISAILSVILIATSYSNENRLKPEYNGITDVWAVKIQVVDIDAAVEFYTANLKFEVLKDSLFPDAVTLKNEGAHIILSPVGKRTEWDYTTGSRFNLNLYVEDLERFIHDLHDAGVGILDDTLLTAGVGKYIRILDPSGNQLHIMELGYEHEPVDKPTVYNVGARITTMHDSREFYEQLLGFEVLTDAYYPPVIPYQLRGIQLILHEGGAFATHPVYPDASQTILVLTTGNLTGEIDRLQKAGVKPILSEPRRSSAGRYNAVRDPDGNVIEIIELTKE